MRKQILLSVIVCSVTLLSAQPSLSDVFPIPGESFTAFSVDPFVPAETGANVTWDYSDLSSTEMRTFNYLDPSDTPNGASFPDATLAFEESGNYEYSKITGTMQERVGVFGNNVLIEYSDPAIYLETDLNFDGSMIDQFEATFVSSGVEFTRAGTAEMSYVGYGTLMLPTAQLENAILYRVIEDYTDSYVFMGIPQTIDYFVTTYIWYYSGYHIPVLSSTMGEVSGGQVFSAGFFADIVTVSSQEVLNNSAFISVFPNPAGSNCTISLNLKKAETVNLAVLDLSGKTILQFEKQKLQPGNHEFPIDTGALAAGTYIAKLQTNQEVQSALLVVD